MATHLLDRRCIEGKTGLNSDARVEDTIQHAEATTVASSLASFGPLTGAVSAALDQRGGKETILLVEDEAFVRKATGEVLESAGYNILMAENASDALEVYCKCDEPIDLLISDVIMPGMNGQELAARFEALFPRVRILLMSGYSEQLISHKAAPGRNECMAKPFSIPILLKKVREVLDRSSLDFIAPLIPH
jgi:CheY-like chemotaxis protein